eukprot:66865-Pyramimonas_sp.AAC.1
MPSPLVRLVHTAGICPLPSSDWSTLRAYALSPRSIGPHCEHMPSPLVRLVHAAGICPLPVMTSSRSIHKRLPTGRKRV